MFQGGVQIFRNIRTGGNHFGGVQIFYDRRIVVLFPSGLVPSLHVRPLLVRVLSRVTLFVLGPFLTHTRHAGYLVKCRTSVSTS